MSSYSQPRILGQIGRISNFAIGVIVGASLACAVVSAAHSPRRDGLFWKGLGNEGKGAYVAGYTDAMNTSLSKIDYLKVASGLLRWKGASKILSQVVRSLDLSGIPSRDLVTRLDQLYSNPRYDDFAVAMAIEVVAMRGAEGKPSSDSSPANGANSSGRSGFGPAK